MNEATEPTSKVVRLPRDWLGPHDELVPFGRSSAPSEPVPAAPQVAPSTPSAEDFWGGRSGAVHDVVQAPSYLAPEVTASAGRPMRAAPRFRLGRRRLAAASTVVGAVAAAIVLLSAGPTRPVAGGARLNLAAILSGGVARALRIGPPRIVAATGTSRADARQVVRHISHRASPPRPAPRATPHQSAPAPAPTYAARATSGSGATPAYRSNVSAPNQGASASLSPARPSPSSGASVSPTGESGALGPVQSPNG